MPLYIMYFNLQNGVSEEEFIKKTSEWVYSLKDRIEGLGSMKLFRHYNFGANCRTYQMVMEFKDFSTWDKFLAFEKNNVKATKLRYEWENLVDMNTHFDEFVHELLLQVKQ